MINLKTINTYVPKFFKKFYNFCNFSSFSLCDSEYFLLSDNPLHLLDPNGICINIKSLWERLLLFKISFMEKMYHEQLNWCLKFFTFLGVPTKKNDFLRKLHYLINLISMLSITLLTVYKMYITRPFDIEFLGQVSTPLTTFVHATNKLTSLFIRKSEVYDLLERSRLKFWEVENTEEMKRIDKLLKNLKKFFFFSVWFFILSTIFKTIVSRDVAYKCYEPEWFPKFAMIIFQDYTSTIVILTLGTFDVLVQTLLMIVMVQYKMVNNKLREIFTYKKGQDINSTEMTKRLKECVDHQNFLIDFIKRFSDAFSVTLLLFIGNIIMSVCMSVYILLSDFSKLNDKIEAVAHTMAGLSEIFLCYSIPAQLLMEEAAKISSSVYLSNWYENPKYAKEILPIMIRDKKPMTIMAGGFVMIDIQMFIMACKTILSYTMFLNTMTQLQRQ